jgi:hypothetical protein
MPEEAVTRIDIAYFADPAPHLLGNSGIGHVRGPGLHNRDFSVSERVGVRENRSIEFRIEFPNLFNTAHSPNTGAMLGTTTLGRMRRITLPPLDFEPGLKFSFTSSSLPAWTLGVFRGLMIRGDVETEATGERT